MLITGTLFIMMVLTFFAIILGVDFEGGFIELTVDNEAIVDGVSSTFEVEIADTLFNIDPITGAIVIITALIVLATLIGIQILASGLSPASVRIIVICTAYIGLWIILSALVSSLIFNIEVFGSVIYITLTIVYTLGVVQKITGSDN